MLALRVYTHAPRKFAMKIGGEYRVDRIRERHLERLAGDFGIRPAAMRDRILSLVERILAGCVPAREQLPEPWASAPILDEVSAFIKQNTEALAREAQQITAAGRNKNSRPDAPGD